MYGGHNVKFVTQYLHKMFLRLRTVWNQRHRVGRTVFRTWITVYLFNCVMPFNKIKQGIRHSSCREPWVGTVVIPSPRQAHNIVPCLLVVKQGTLSATPARTLASRWTPSCWSCYARSFYRVRVPNAIFANILSILMHLGNILLLHLIQNSM
jgi:hypothetical protein